MVLEDELLLTEMWCELLWISTVINSSHLWRTVQGVEAQLSLLNSLQAKLSLPSYLFMEGNFWMEELPANG